MKWQQLEFPFPVTRQEGPQPIQRFLHVWNEAQREALRNKKPPVLVVVDKERKA